MKNIFRKINPIAAGGISSLAGLTISIIAFKTIRLSNQILLSLSNEDFLFGDSNSPSIPIWENYRLYATIAFIAGLILLAAGVCILFWLIRRFFKSQGINNGPAASSGS
ncbi:MAG: hypothetical protein IKE58_07340 [Blautia sp.]|nr:hypothetical protein [Blautia sp.]